MRKLIVLCLFLAMAVPAYAGVNLPTVYGKLNKELRTVKQNQQYNYTNMTGANDVDNSESRLGAKGSHKIGDTTAAYTLEMGFNSTNGGTERIRTRLAVIKLSDFWGTFQIGQDYTATALIGLQIDPLAGTSAGLIGVDASDNVRWATAHVGWFYRARRDLIGYKTPKWNGLQWHTTLDYASNDLSTQPGNGTVWENLFTYDYNLGGGNKFDLHFGYSKSSGVSTNHEEALTGGLRFTAGAITVAFKYTDREAKYNSQGLAVTDADKHMMGTFKYVFGANTIALTWGEHEDDEGLLKTKADVTKYSQIAAGYFYKCSKNLSLRGTYANYKVKEDDATLALSQNNNAKTFALGAQLTF